MARVKVSSEYRITIPRSVREAVGLQAGEMVTVLAMGDAIEMVPDRDLWTLEGAYPQVSLAAVRDESDR